MSIEFVKVENLRPSEWRINHALTPDLAQIKISISQFGWLYPILVRKETASIIDGFHRWLVASDDKKLLVDGKIPVQWIDCDEVTAMAMHIKLNRNRGIVVARHLSTTILKMIEMVGDENAVQNMLGIGNDEFEILSQPKFLKMKKLAEHSYSRAWVPVEVAPGAPITVPDIQFERPPTPDH